MPEEVIVKVERPEGFEHLSEDEWRKRLKKAMSEEEQRAREERRVGKRSVVGRKAVLEAKTTDTPDTVEPRRELRPHIACLDAALRIRVLKALELFRVQRTEALLKMLAGKLGVVFPFGTYRIRSGVAPPYFNVAPASAA
jgi:hypothetical protein